MFEGYIYIYILSMRGHVTGQVFLFLEALRSASVLKITVAGAHVQAVEMMKSKVGAHIQTEQGICTQAESTAWTTGTKEEQCTS